MKNRRWALYSALFLFVIGAILYIGQDVIRKHFFNPTGSSLKEGLDVSTSAIPQTVSQNLNVPWEIAFLPGGDMLITERPGVLKRIGTNKQSHNIEGVEHVGEGGLLGLALHPDFDSNHYLYLYLTTKEGNDLLNRVERYVYNNDRLSEKTLIIGNIPGAANHDGGRLAFGPDGYLYITTGDANQEEQAQNKNTLRGKILRLTDSGQIPADNPFGNAVYSYGHRNVQGIAWDDKKQLWATEHGRSGLQSGYDELNFIKKGANYGWPLIQGDQTRSGMEKPVVNSGPDETWAPSGMVYANGSLFFSGLRGESLYEAKIRGNTVNLQSHYRNDFGRLRAVTVYSGNIYFSTSNTDGRGDPKDNDDKILSISSDYFKN